VNESGRDTDVFISAALKEQSFPALALRGVIQNGTLLKSAATEHQLFEVLSRPQIARVVEARTVEWIRNIVADAEAVMVIERIAACRDNTDDKFLELAVNGNADVIVSGDADLLVLHPFRGIPVISPAQFVRASGWRQAP